MDAWKSYQGVHRDLPGSGHRGYRDDEDRPRSFGGKCGKGGGKRGKGRPESMMWQGMEIILVQKDLSFEHPAASVRSDEECEWIRIRNAISVLRNYSDEELPRPICTMDEVPIPDSVHDLLLRRDLLKPTPIQMQAWPIILKGCDMAGVAEPGAGRTLAFAMPMLVHIMSQPELRPGEGPIGVVLCPTWEACEQVAYEVDSFRGNSPINCVTFRGGDTVTHEDRQDASSMNIVVCTPGWLIALLNNRATNLRRATFFVLEGADQLLGPGGCEEQVEQVALILGQSRPDRQVLLFASTWSSDVEDIANRACRHRAVYVHVSPVKMRSCRNVLQRFTRVWAGQPKDDLLTQALEPILPQLAAGEGRALIYCSSPSSVRNLVAELQQRRYLCEALHEEQDPAELDCLAELLREPDSGIWMLVCTDFPCNLDLFGNVRYIIHYDMPRQFVEYIQRLARINNTPMKPGHDRTGFSNGLLNDEDVMAGLGKDLITGLKEMGQEVPTWLQSAFSSGRARGSRSGKGGHQAGRPYGKGPLALEAGSPQAQPHQHQQLQPPPGHRPQPASGWHQPRAQAASQASPVWQGRGRGRRDVFLHMCSGRGPARPASPGLEPPRDLF